MTANGRKFSRSFSHNKIFAKNTAFFKRWPIDSYASFSK
jgi:hypothetical protein